MDEMGGSEWSGFWQENANSWEGKIYKIFDKEKIDISTAWLRVLGCHGFTIKYGVHGWSP